MAVLLCRCCGARLENEADKSDAKALAAAFGWNNRPDVHGPGMYGHYHDSTHTFHIWYGGAT